jgi:thiamine pyrophosphokinase
MDIASIAAAFVAAQAGQLQTAVAAKMLRMNAQASADTAKLLEAAQQNFNRLANVAGGVGGSLDITA